MQFRRVSTTSAHPGRRRGPAAVLVGFGLLAASVLGAPVSAASSGAAGAPADPNGRTPNVARPRDPAVPAGTLAVQSPNQPLAYQLVQRLTATVPEGLDAAAGEVAAQLDRATPDVTVAQRLLRSPAGIPASISDHAYLDLLGRPADAAGLAYFENRIASGASFEWVQRAVAASAEFGTVHTTADSQVDALYHAVLDRAPDPGGAAYFAGRLRTGDSPAMVASTMQHAPEYGAGQVEAAYQRLLWRAADPGGLDYWSGVVTSRGWIDAAAALAASAEFRNFGCDPIAAGSCMLPWPNDYFTRPDPGAVTGRRVDLKPSEVPANSSGTRIDPSQINRSDGFSPGSTLMVQIPGVDVEASGFPTLADMNRNDAPLAESPVLLYDTDAHERIATWTELDLHAPYENPADQLLLIHPVRNLTDGHHYVVALRNLKNAAGGTIPAPPVFAAYRDGTTSPVAGFDQRRDHMNAVLDTVTANGFPRDTLYLAWDFTVASTPNITGRLLHMRDDAFAQLGGAAPAFRVTSVTAGTHAGIDRVVEGTFDVPNYLSGAGGPGSTFVEDANGLPRRNGTLQAPFRCVVPTAALSTPARASLYGHGLFGSLNEVTAGNVQDMAAEHDMVFCGTLWLGMSNADIPTAAGVLGDLSGFDKLADPLQQGVLNFLFLARLMKMNPGLAADPAFQNSRGVSVIAPGAVYYDGNSQGGIEGGVVMAASTDITRGVLGVSGLNYPSLLLPRSTDFETFEKIMKPAYPSELDRMLGLALIQLEWDRAEPDGYANHMTTDPLPGTPQHRVLMQIALGDHQVSDYAADTEARTIGAKAHCPAFDAGRVPDTRLLWGISCIDRYPYDGSAIVYFDSGADLPLLTNTLPPSGHDPHEDPRNDPAARRQKSAFLQPDATSRVIDVCGGAGCHAAQD